MPRVLNKKRASQEQLQDAVYVGRPSKWGNPFTHRKDVADKRDDVVYVETRESAVRNYPYHLLANPELLLAAMNELKGKDLVCWCHEWDGTGKNPKYCHADILLELVNDDVG